MACSCVVLWRRVTDRLQLRCWSKLKSSELSGEEGWFPSSFIDPRQERVLCRLLDQGPQLLDGSCWEAPWFLASWTFPKGSLGQES